jgi:hypothetical protein
MMKADVATADSKQDDRTIPNRNVLGSTSTHFLENIVKSNSTMANGSIELARETIAFSQTRLQANIDGWMALSKCENLSDLSECQMELAKKATSQYTEAASTFLHRWANLASSISTPGREQSQSL